MKLDWGNPTYFSLYPMGVINITPDSFSDGGQWLDPQKLKQNLEEWSSLGSNVLWDVGAESTAPHAKKLQAQDEITRWDQFFFPTYESLIKERPQYLGQSLSVDSYHVDTMKHILKRLQSLKFQGRLIWNDISGKFDQQVSDLLQQHADLFYVYCYNLAPTREESQDHGKNLYGENHSLTDREYFLHMVDYFHGAIIQASKIGALDRLILDPTFGFSKSREQNFLLWRLLPSIMQELAHPYWLIGVSRKSFLRPAGSSIHDPGIRESAEWSEAWMLGNLVGQLQFVSELKQVIVRGHSRPFLSTLLNFYRENFRQ